MQKDFYNIIRLKKLGSIFFILGILMNFSVCAQVRSSTGKKEGRYSTGGVVGTKF